MSGGVPGVGSISAMNPPVGNSKRAFSRYQLVTAAIAGLLILAPALVKFFSYPAYPGPDGAFLQVAVAEHILDGKGWGIVSHDRVNLTSSPIFILVLVAVLAIGSIGLAQIVSVGFGCAALAVTFFATRSITESSVCGLAALAVAAADVHLWHWSGVLMETSLAYLAVTVIAAMTLWMMRGRWTGTPMFMVLGALIGLGTLVRFEIGILLPLSIAALWFSRHPSVLRLVAVGGGFLIPVLPWFAFATSYFGSPLPTTYFGHVGSFHIVNTGIVKADGTAVVTGVGLSILIAAVAVVLARRTSDGRAKLRSYAMPLCFLLSWPIALFGFHYLKTPVGSARYALPGMATWPMAVGLVIAAVPPKPRNLRWLTAALGGCLAVALVINVVTLRPALNSFNSGYRPAMTAAAQYLRDHCKPGEVAVFLDNGLGIGARDGIGDCTLMDTALATPQLSGIPLEQLLTSVRPTYVVEGRGPRGLSGDDLPVRYPQLVLLRSQSYASSELATPRQLTYLNIYRVNNH